MTDGFIRKKVESLTLGEKLKKLRQQYRMSYAEIAKATRIQAKYLEALENGAYEKLPAEVYIRGFLRSYARYLGLDDEAFLKLYDKEKNIRVNLGHEHKVVEPPRYPAMSSWVITPRAALISVLVVVLGSEFSQRIDGVKSFFRGLMPFGKAEQAPPPPPAPGSPEAIEA
ncbi:MAG: helix-turn-helix domain-containing protein, partial [Undibacterium sp.]